MISTLTVKAESATFYEAEFIDNIYMNRYRPANHTTYYQKARVNRDMETNEFVYCIEPYTPIYYGTVYEATTTPTYLSDSQIDTITKLAYFGYGYQNHTDIKWYPITQVLIWQVSDPTGDFYFTDGLNGPRTDRFQNEMNELLTLVNNYSIMPSFSNKSYDIVENHSLTLQDTNHVLQNYTISDENLIVENNTIFLQNLKEGNYEYTFTKEAPLTYPTLFYYASTSQNLVKRGSINKIESKIKIQVQKTHLEITKIDKDTQSTTPSGEASFEGTTYTLYDKNKNPIQEYSLENNQIHIDNLDYGTYYLKETKVGEGYLLNEDITEIEITKEKPKHSIILENKVIEKKIIIRKLYGEGNSYQEEKDISFAIQNQKEELIKIIQTNEEGIVETTLPYGTYTITQINTTDGYEKADTFIIQVTNQEVETIELRDIKIPVPDTYKEKEHSFRNILIYLLWILLIRQ